MGSRVSNSIRNTIVGMAGLFINLIVTFVAKSIFVRLLGAEYNGVNGLFSNILNILNMAELGFSASIAVCLYKPLKEHDEMTAGMLMKYFVRVYRIIAIIVAVAGCCCIPFLQYLIAEDISTLPFTLNELRAYFAMFLANTVFGYLLAYKRTIIEADQKAFIISGVDNICNIALNILQIVLLLVYKNYYAFLAIMIAKTIINNLILHIIAGKKYPYLSKYKGVKISKEYKTTIFTNVRAMFLNKIGYNVIFNTTSIIISAFVSLVDAGKYSNYQMICTNIYAFVTIIFSSLSASVGNLWLDDNTEYQLVVFKRIQYMAFFFAVFTFCCYICLFNDFIALWVGEDMVFALPTVIMISMNAMILYLRRVVNTFRDTRALYRHDKYKPILESVVGLGLAIGLSYVWGTFGVLLGYNIAMLFVSAVIENYTLYKKGFKSKGLAKQYISMAGVILFAFALTALMYFITDFFPKGVGWFVLKLVFCVVFAAGAFILVSFRSPEFKYYKNLVIRICKAMIVKIKNRKKVAVQVVESEGKTASISDKKDESSQGDIDKEEDEGAENQAPSGDGDVK